MLIVLLRHFPLAAAVLAFSLLEIGTGTFLSPHPHFEIRAYIGISVFIGLAIIVWIIANSRRSRPVEEKED